MRIARITIAIVIAAVAGFGLAGCATTLPMIGDQPNSVTDPYSEDGGGNDNSSVASMYSGTWAASEDGHRVGTFVINANYSDPAAIAANSGVPLPAITGGFTYDDPNQLGVTVQVSGVSMNSNSLNFTRTVRTPELSHRDSQYPGANIIDRMGGSSSQTFSLHRSGNDLVGTASNGAGSRNVLWTRGS